MDGEFSFTAAELDRGGKTYRFALTAKWLQSALDARVPEPGDLPPGAQQPAQIEALTAGTNDGTVEVRASRSDKEVVVHGSASACLRVTCARCTKPFEQDVRASVSALFVPKSKLKTDYEISTDDADVEPFDGETVILDDLVMDALLLEIPMIPLCSEDCPGMSAPLDVAETPAIDPRLAPLLRFKGSA